MTETSPEYTLPTSFAAYYSELDDDKKGVHTKRGHSSSHRTTTSRSHPTTTSDPRDRTAGRAIEGDAVTSSSGQKPVPAERSSKREDQAAAADRQRHAEETSGERDRSTGGSSQENTAGPPKELFAHWEKVFGKEGLETTANQSDIDLDESHVSRQDAGNVKRVAAVEKLEYSPIVNPQPVALKPEAGPAHEGAPQARKRSRKSSPKESPNLKRTTAMDNLTTQGVQPKDAAGAEARGGELVDFPLATQLQETQRPGVAPRNVHGPKEFRKGKKEAPGKREMPGSSHPAPSSPTYKYYLSRSSSRSSDHRGPDMSSRQPATLGEDIFKGCLHAGKILSPTRRTPEMTSLVPSLPIVEEKESQKQLPPVQLPRAVPDKTPVATDRKASAPPKPVVERVVKPVTGPLKKDVKDVPTAKAVEPVPGPSKEALAPMSEAGPIKSVPDKTPVPTDRKASAPKPVAERVVKPVMGPLKKDVKEDLPTTKAVVPGPGPSKEALAPMSEAGPVQSVPDLVVDKRKDAGAVESREKSLLKPPPVPYVPGEMLSKSDSAMQIETLPSDSERRSEEPKVEDKTEQSLKTEEHELPTLSVEYPPTGSYSDEEDAKDAALPKAPKLDEVVEKEGGTSALFQSPPEAPIEKISSPEERPRGDLKVLEVESLDEHSTPHETQGEFVSPTGETEHSAAVSERHGAPLSEVEGAVATSPEAAIAEVEEPPLPKEAEDQLPVRRPEDEAGEGLPVSRLDGLPVLAETETSKKSGKSVTASAQEGERATTPPEEAELTEKEGDQKTFEESHLMKSVEEEEKLMKSGETEAEEAVGEEQAGEEGAETERAETMQPEGEEETHKEEVHEDLFPLPDDLFPLPESHKRETEVQVEIAFVKPRGNEAYYTAYVRIRTIPMLLLLGNIIVLIILLIASYFDLFVLFYVGPAIVPVTPASTKGLGLVCRTIRCGIGGTTLYYAINHNVEPCDSMFKYVCERWIHEPSEKYQAVVLGAEKSVIDEMYAEMRRGVESYHAYAKSGHALGKLAMLYKSCQDTYERDRQGVGPLNKLRQEYTLHEWPFKERFNGKPEEMVARYIRDTGSGVFVSVRMIPDPDDPQEHATKLIALECSTFALPTDMLLTYRSTHKEAIKAYRSYISSNLEDFNPSSPEKMVSNIFAFEVNLAHRCNVQCRRKRLKKIKVSEMSSDSGINWAKFLNTVMENVRYNVGPDTSILVRSVSYFKKLALIFRDGATKTRAMNYLGWRFMQKLSRHTTQKYRKSHREFQENVLGQLRLDDWMRCMFDAAEAMPMAIGRVYVERQGFEASDYRVYGMMLSLLEGLRHMFAEFKWLQAQSREKVSVILSKASMTIGYPAWLMNDSALNAYYAHVPTDGSYVEMVAKALSANYANLLTTSVTLEVPSKLANFIFPSRFVELHHRSGPPRESLLYDIRSNHFVLPSGVMTPPYYVSDTTWSMNFGGLGVLVARDLVNEFLHAVDAGWMADSDRTEFKKSADCVLTEVGKSSRSGSPDEAVMRCGGLVSDLLALRLAYTAYHTHADSRDEPTVPGMEDKSPDQVFFTAAFRTLCTQLRERHYVPVVRGKEKVPELQYLDALMRSMNEFTDAFKCPDGKYRRNVVGRCLAGEAGSRQVQVTQACPLESL
ncbi:hypothetical protein HPB48_004746 [Haemaphysalis longicornis]|uniref:Uncharacterized protein n=1 Tax=Haemaphysalis longicornis TaxID=44386 RepID=A0A9J6G181_HAELO|nr:hypothetical protein HPB48_004746 [Haemaphysalis longicornis]